MFIHCSHKNTCWLKQSSKNYYPKTFSGECRYKLKEEETVKDSLLKYLTDFDSDSKNRNENNFNKILSKAITKC